MSVAAASEKNWFSHHALIYVKMNEIKDIRLNRVDRGLKYNGS